MVTQTELQHGSVETAEPSRRTSLMTTCSSALDLGLGWRWRTQSTLQRQCCQMAEPKPSPNISQRSEHGVHRHCPANLQWELERSCKEEWDKLPQNRCAELKAPYSKRLEALIATKYWAKAVNIRVHVLFILSTFTRTSSKVLLTLSLRNFEVKREFNLF